MLEETIFQSPSKVLNKHRLYTDNLLESCFQQWRDILLILISKRHKNPFTARLNKGVTRSADKVFALLNKGRNIHEARIPTARSPCLRDSPILLDQPSILPDRRGSKE